jgi:hypothetical protein
MNHVLYAGYVEYAEGNVTRRKGHHVPIISYDTFEKMQERLKSRRPAQARADLGRDYILRGIVDCDECSAPLKSGWSKGRSGLHAHYCCHTKTCPSYGKSIRRAEIEGQFEAELRALTPSEENVSHAYHWLKQVWKDLAKLVSDRAASVKAELHRLEQQADKLISMLLDASDSFIAKRYEQKLSDIEHQRIALQESLNTKKAKKADFGAKNRTAFAFLANPYKLWEKGTFEDRRKVLRLTLSDHLSYHRNEGFRTAKTTLPFKVLGQIYASKKHMVRTEGLELMPWMPPKDFLTDYSFHRQYSDRWPMKNKSLAMPTIQQRLGHFNLDSTARYKHFEDRYLIEVAQQISQPTQ